MPSFQPKHKREYKDILIWPITLTGVLYVDLFESNKTILITVSLNNVYSRAKAGQRIMKDFSVCNVLFPSSGYIPYKWHRWLVGSELHDFPIQYLPSLIMSIA